MYQGAFCFMIDTIDAEMVVYFRYVCNVKQ